MSRSNRLLAIILGLILLAAVGAYATTHVLRQRITAEVEAVFAAIRPTFAKAEHGPLEFDVWSRTLKIPDIVFEPKGAGPDKATRIASLTAHDVGRAGSSLTAARLEVSDMDLGFDYGPDNASHARYALKSATVNTVALKPFAPAPDDRIKLAANILRAFEIGTIAVPQIATTITTPRPPSAVLNRAGTPPRATPPSSPLLVIEQTHHDVLIESIRDGRLGKTAIARIEMDLPMPTAGMGTFTGDIRDISMTNHDIATLLDAFSNDAPSVTTGMTLVAATTRTGALKFRLGSMGNMSIDSVALDRMRIAPAKLKPAWLALQANQPTPGQRNLPPKQQQALVTAMTDLYESIALGNMSYKGLKVDIKGAQPFALGAFVMDGYENGRLAQFVLTDVSGKTPKNEPFVVKRFALNGLRFVELMRLGARATAAVFGPRQPPPAATDFFRLLDGFELSGASTPGKGPGERIDIARLEASWGDYIGALPGTGKHTVKITGPISALDKEPFSLLKRTGRTSATISWDGGWRWQEPGTIAIGPMRFEIDGLLAATAEARLDDVTRDMLARPETLPLTLQAARLGSIRIAVRDSGLLKIMSSDPELATQHRQAIDKLTAVDPAAPPDPPRLAEIKAGLAHFLSTPGGELTISVTPTSPITLGELSAHKDTGPAFLAFLSDRATIEVKTSR